MEHNPEEKSLILQPILLCLLWTWTKKYYLNLKIVVLKAEEGILEKEIIPNQSSKIFQVPGHRIRPRYGPGLRK
jgi:hypothetical protein